MELNVLNVYFALKASKYFAYKLFEFKQTVKAFLLIFLSDNLVIYTKLQFVAIIPDKGTEKDRPVICCCGLFDKFPLIVEK